MQVASREASILEMPLARGVKQGVVVHVAGGNQELDSRSDSDDDNGGGGDNKFRKEREMWLEARW